MLRVDLTYESVFAFEAGYSDFLEEGDDFITRNCGDLAHDFDVVLASECLTFLHRHSLVHLVVFSESHGENR